MTADFLYFATSLSTQRYRARGKVRPGAWLVVEKVYQNYRDTKGTRRTKTTEHGKMKAQLLIRTIR